MLRIESQCSLVCNALCLLIVVLYNLASGRRYGESKRRELRKLLRGQRPPCLTSGDIKCQHDEQGRLLMLGLRQYMALIDTEENPKINLSYEVLRGIVSGATSCEWHVAFLSLLSAALLNEARKSDGIEEPMFFPHPILLNGMFVGTMKYLPQSYHVDPVLEMNKIPEGLENFILGCPKIIFFSALKFVDENFGARRLRGQSKVYASERHLPGLFIGTSGLLCAQSERQAKRNEVLSYVMNLLLANDIRGRETNFKPIEIDVGGVLVSCIGDFLSHLLSLGWIISSETGQSYSCFGLYLGLEWEGVDIPCCAAIKMPGTAEELPSTQIAHAALHVVIALPDDFDLRIQFYSGNNGFCGFHADNVWDWPWVKPDRENRYHVVSKTLDLQAILRAKELATIINHVARENKMPVGGYGRLGVCSDSVALLELRTTGSSNIYPIFMPADSKLLLSQGADHLGMDKWKDVIEETRSDLAPETSTIVDMRRRASFLEKVFTNDRFLFNASAS